LGDVISKYQQQEKNIKQSHNGQKLTRKLGELQTKFDAEANKTIAVLRGSFSSSPKKGK